MLHQPIFLQDSPSSEPQDIEDREWRELRNGGYISHVKLLQADNLFLHKFHASSSPTLTITRLQELNFGSWSGKWQLKGTMWEQCKARLSWCTQNALYWVVKNLPDRLDPSHNTVLKWSRHTKCRCNWFHEYLCRAIVEEVPDLQRPNSWKQRTPCINKTLLPPRPWYIFLVASLTYVNELHTAVNRATSSGINNPDSPTTCDHKQFKF